MIILSIKENTAIPVLNYNNHNVCAPSNIQTYFFEPCKDNVPTICYISFPEIAYINSQSDCFRTGLLVFGEDVGEEVYNALHINDWKSLMSNAEIKRILTESTKEGLEKLINITNNSVFDRVMSMLVSLKNSGTDDISTRVVRTVEARADELRKGIRKTNIKILFNNTGNSADSAELDNVKAENAKLQEQIAAMQKQMSELLNNSGAVGKAENETSDTENSEESKKPGRPVKNK